MQARVVSDLHIDHHRDLGETILAEISAIPAEVLVIAGDLNPVTAWTDRQTELFRSCCEAFRTVLYVPGNHEYYGSSLEAGDCLLEDFVASINNLTLLNNDTCVIGGVRFIGSTLWFPERPDDLLYRQLLNDFMQIQGFRRQYGGRHREAKRFLQQNVTANSVVITHNLPSAASIAPRFRASQLNRFFVGDAEDVIFNNKPQLWIHGHTHIAIDYVLENTKVICNPLGYPHEVQDFDAQLTVEVA